MTIQREWTDGEDTFDVTTQYSLWHAPIGDDGWDDRDSWLFHEPFYVAPEGETLETVRQRIAQIIVDNFGQVCRLVGGGPNNTRGEQMWPAVPCTIEIRVREVRKCPWDIVHSS